MRREVSRPRTYRIAAGCRPPNPFSDGVVILRNPEASDAILLAHYARDERLLEGKWIGRPTPSAGIDEWAAETVEEWRAGWTDRGGVDGGVLIIDEKEPFVGIVFLAPRSHDTLELVYGILPPVRGYGIASRAARLAADWALTAGGFAKIELRIGENHTASRRVAEKAGFSLEELFETYVTGTGRTHIDTLYTRTRQSG